MIRKKGKLPNSRLFSVKYGLEYGKDELEMVYIPQHDLGTCVIVDDVLIKQTVQLSMIRRFM